MFDRPAVQPHNLLKKVINSNILKKTHSCSLKVHYIKKRKGQQQKLSYNRSTANKKPYL